jgi:hypothetical protein
MFTFLLCNVGVPVMHLELSALAGKDDGVQESWGNATKGQTPWPSIYYPGPMLYRQRYDFSPSDITPPFPYVSMLGNIDADPNTTFGTWLDFGSMSSKEGAELGFTILAHIRLTRAKLARQTLFSLGGGTGAQSHALYRQSDGGDVFTYRYTICTGARSVLYNFTIPADQFVVFGIRRTGVVGISVWQESGGIQMAVAGVHCGWDQVYTEAFVGRPAPTLVAQVGAGLSWPFASFDIKEFAFYDYPMTDSEFNSRAQALVNKQYDVPW